MTTLDNDAVGRTQTQTLPDLRQIGFAYDANSNVTGITPPGRPQHTFAYNAVDRLSTYTPPAVSGVSAPQTGYAYNLDQQSKLVTRPDGLSVTPVYNSVTGRIDHLDTPDGSYVYTWLAGNRVSQLTALGNVQLNYTWDGALLTGATTSGPFSASVGYSYDNNFWLTHLNAAGTTVDYGYDTDGLLTSAAVGTTNLSLTRDAQNGLLDATTLGQVSDTWSYNNFAEPSAYTATANGSAVFSTTFTRDALGRITQKAENLLGQTHITIYTYETSGRLSTVTIDTQPSAEYSYDSNSNRATHTVDVASPLLGKTIPCLGDLSVPITINGSADAQDRMMSYGNCTYTYGANGELQSRTEATTNQATNYTYDVRGNLRHVTQPDGTAIDYVIDGQNRRIGKKINGALIQGFVYASQLKPVAELDGSGSVVATFVYADRTNVPAYMLKGGNVYRLVADQLGSPRLLIDAQTGAVAQRMDYDEWGNVVNDSNPGFQPFGFAGGLYDRDTGLTRFGARDYDPTTGRWTAKDPTSLLGGINVYAYVKNNPLSFIDPFGLKADLILAFPGTPIYNDAMLYTTPDGAFSVVAHARPDGMVDDTLVPHGPLLRADELAERIRQSGWTPGQPIILLGCHTGTSNPDEVALAQDVADILGTDVQGVDKYFFFDDGIPTSNGATEDPNSPTGYTWTPNDAGTFPWFSPLSKW